MASLKKNQPGLKWSSSEPRQNAIVPAHNIVRGGLPCLRGETRNLRKNPEKHCVWNLLFDDVMLRKIVYNTNVKLITNVIICLQK